MAVTTEHIRRQYLQALGIESYFPRWQLPGAAPSPAAEEDLPEDEVQEQTPAAGSLSAAQLVPEVPAPEAPLRARINVELEAKQPRLTITTKAAAPTARGPRFLLGIWQISPHILVLDSRQPSLALPVGRLLENIALALGLKGELPEIELLRWPLSDSGDVHGSEANARDRVRAFLAARAGAQPLRDILLMGAPAIRFALDEGQVAEGGALRSLLGQSFSLHLEGSAVQAHALPSLTAMLQRPALKAGAWATIKHLRQN